MSAPDLSIIIVSFNTRQLLADCLRSVHDVRDEAAIGVFVVDNHSADGSADMVEQDFPWVQLIRNPSNAGFAAANNLALARATGRYVMLLNSDTIVHDGAFRTLVRFMDDRPSAGYCGSNLLNEDGTHLPSARRLPTPLSPAYAMTGMSERKPASAHCQDLHVRLGADTPFRAGWFTGACLVVRRETYREVGPLDDGYFLYYEETDWCRQMAQAGWQGWYVPGAVVTHLGGRSVEHTSQVRPFFGNHPVHWVNSSRRYFRRWYGVGGLVFKQLLLYAAIWLRHVWRRSEQSRIKARTAGSALRYMITA